MSSQYWTAYVYGSYDIVMKAFEQFYNHNHSDYHDDSVDWEIDSQGNNEFLVTRTRTMDDYGNEGHQGDISRNRYVRLENIIQRLESEQEKERLRLEEEKRRRDEEERARKNAAKDEIENAVREGRKFLDSSEFESAERTLLASTRAYTTYSDELDFSNYKQMEVLIQQEKTQWMKNSIKNIEGLISKKSWDDAKSIMDSIRTDRVSSTGFNDQFRKLRTNLNQAKKEWEEAERERLRLEKIANEKRALEMVEEAITNWTPTISERNLLSNETGYLMFIEDLKKSDDWSFLNEHDEWIKSSEKQLGKVADLSLHNAKESLITKILERVVKDDISRDNVLSNEIIGGEANPLEIADMLNVLKQGIAEQFEELWKYISTNDYQIQDSVVEDFTILFVEARTAYVEEIIRSKNTEFAKAMVGNVLGLQEDDDFVTKVADSYIGEHAVRVFVDDENGNRQELFGDDIVKHIEQGSNLVIILEECYYTEQEKMHGHIKNRKIFEN